MLAQAGATICGSLPPRRTQVRPPAALEQAARPLSRVGAAGGRVLLRGGQIRTPARCRSDCALTVPLCVAHRWPQLQAYVQVPTDRVAVSRGGAKGVVRLARARTHAPRLVVGVGDPQGCGRGAPRDFRKVSYGPSVLSKSYGGAGSAWVIISGFGGILDA